MKYYLILFIIILNSCSQKVDKNFDSNNREDVKQLIRMYDAKKINEDAMSHFVDALMLQQQGNWAESLIDLQLALEKDESAGIYYSIAKAYITLDRPEHALKALDKALIQNPRFLPTLELLVELHIKNMNYNKAINVYKEIIKIDNSFRRKLNFANILEYYKPSESIELYEELYNEDTRNDKILLKLVQLYKSTKQQNKYLKSLEKLVEIKESSSKYSLDLLDLYLEQNDFDSALKLLEKVDKNISTTELDKFYGTVGYKMLYDSTFQDRKLINDYLGRIDSRFYFNWQIQLQSAYLYSKVEDEEKTYTLFKKVLKISDTIPDIPISIAIFYMQKMNDSLAFKIISETEDKFKNDYRFPFFKGLTSHSLKKYEIAISSYRRSIDIEPEFLDNWIQLGIVYDQIKMSDSSDYFYQMALNLDSLNPLVNNNYAYSLSIRGKSLNKAKFMSEIALSMEPTNAAYLDTYAWINYLMGNYKIALDYIEKAIKIGGASAELFEHYGDILKKLNRQEDALSAYKNALEKEPERISVIERINNLKSD